jgi:hypothetical protein
VAQRKAVARTWEKAARQRVIDESMDRFREAARVVVSGLSRAHEMDGEEAEFLRREVLAGRPIATGHTSAELKIIADANKSKPPFYLKFHADMIMESVRQSGANKDAPKTSIVAIPTTDSE